MEYSYRDELYHHGIKGQKWGVRRFQNSDRTWTAAGKARYGDGGTSSKNRSVSGGDSRSSANKMGTAQKGKIDSDKLKKAAKIGAAVAGTALAAYGAYKLNSALNKNVSMHYREMGQKALEASMKASLRADAYDAGGYRHSWSSVAQKSSSFERSMAKELAGKARDYRQLSRQGSYSAREKADALKRMIKR